MKEMTTINMKEEVVQEKEESLPDQIAEEEMAATAEREAITIVNMAAGAEAAEVLAIQGVAVAVVTIEEGKEAIAEEGEITKNIIEKIIEKENSEMTEIGIIEKEDLQETEIKDQDLNKIC